MSLKTIIEDIVSTLDGSPTFIFGTATELNSIADYVDMTDKPAVFMHALQQEKGVLSKSGGRKVAFGIYLEFLSIVEFEEYTSEADAVVQEMRELKNQFLAKIDLYTDADGNIVFNRSGGDTDKSNNVYHKYDTNTCGVNLEIDLKEMYKNSFC